MENIETQIERLKQQQREISNRLINLKNRQSKAERAREARRLILAGQWLLRTHGDDIQEVGELLADAGMLKASDRVLFDLPAAEKAM